MGKIRYPKDETVWCCYSNKAGRIMFLITSKGFDRSAYFLYEVLQDNTCKKLGKSKSPIDLEKKYKVMEAISA